MKNSERKYAFILNVRVDSTSASSVLKAISLKLKAKTKFLIVTPNPEIILLAQKDLKLKKVLNEADLALPDGTGLVLAARFLGEANLNVVQGRKIMLLLLEMAQKMRLKIFLLGSTEKVIEKSLEKIKNDYPGLSASGASGPRLNRNAEPISKSDGSINKEAVEEINNFQPDILFVAFGAPKQEKWIGKFLPELKIGGAMVVGGALDYFAGVALLPPAYLEKLHLEWLWRLIREPQRLRRIVNAVIIFPLYVIFAALNMREKAIDR